MKFDIPKIIKPLEMSEYDEAMEGLVLQVWVNLPRRVHAEYWEFQSDLLKLTKELDVLLKPETPDDEKITALNKRLDKNNRAIFAWFANLWSQSEDLETHVTVDEIDAMAEEDPTLWRFMTNRTLKLIRDHQESVRKN